uniref:Uncharacterized protein n=1 Tax=Siphoviridae sp. ctrpM6 TaxID=2827956 RepID=A0A8S5T4S4_9CAUD|nr:MAG TPA: hypothetical protein [Siphoviridae sp. ctrpM6]
MNLRKQKPKILNAMLNLYLLCPQNPTPVSLSRCIFKHRKNRKGKPSFIRNELKKNTPKQGVGKISGLPRITRIEF